MRRTSNRDHMGGFQKKFPKYILLSMCIVLVKCFLQTWPSINTLYLIERTSSTWQTLSFSVKKHLALVPNFMQHFTPNVTWTVILSVSISSIERLPKTQIMSLAFYKQTTSQTTKHLPVSQWVPVYPSAHPQVYELTASVHVAPFIQGVLAHSFTSIKK